MCRNDIKVLHYSLQLQLSDQVLDEAKFETQSVGRLAITLKKAQAAKWDQLVQGVKPGNMVVWWDLVEKYEKELESAGESQEGAASQQQDSQKKRVKKVSFSEFFFVMSLFVFLQGSKKAIKSGGDEVSVAQQQDEL